MFSLFEFINVQIFMQLTTNHIIFIRQFTLNETIRLKQVTVCKFAVCVKNFLSLKQMQSKHKENYIDFHHD